VKASNEIRRLRRQQIVNLSITELMLLLVFMAVTFSFLSKEEGRNEVSIFQKENEELKAANALLHKRIDELEDESQKLVAERDQARRELEELRQEFKDFLPDAGAPKPNSDPLVAVHRSAIMSFSARIKQLEGQAQQVEARNQTLEKDKADLESKNRQLLVIVGKAPGLPLCASPKGYLLTLTINADGTITGAKLWSADAEETALALPGISVLSSGQDLQGSEFDKAATKLQGWEDAQSDPCRFRIRLKRLTRDADLFDKQLHLVERFFYVARIQ
jgi:cell division protein FtsB